MCFCLLTFFFFCVMQYLNFFPYLTSLYYNAHIFLLFHAFFMFSDFYFLHLPSLPLMVAILSLWLTTTSAEDSFSLWTLISLLYSYEIASPGLYDTYLGHSNFPLTLPFEKNRKKKLRKICDFLFCKYKH